MLVAVAARPGAGVLKDHAGGDWVVVGPGDWQVWQRREIPGEQARHQRAHGRRVKGPRFHGSGMSHLTGCAHADSFDGSFHITKHTKHSPGEIARGVTSVAGRRHIPYSADCFPTVKVIGYTPLHQHELGHPDSPQVHEQVTSHSRNSTHTTTAHTSLVRKVISFLYLGLSTFEASRSAAAHAAGVT